MCQYLSERIRRLIEKIREMEKENNFGPLDLSKWTNQEIEDYYWWITQKC